jgi:DNA-binding transcriptional ArsR family regulator
VVKYGDAHLDQTFSALGNPTRRAILDRLSTEPGLSVSELARPLSMKLPAIMKHLDVLSEAGLISRSKCGRVVSVSLVPEPMAQAMRWLERHETFWSSGLDRLAAYAEGQEVDARKKNR